MGKRAKERQLPVLPIVEKMLTLYRAACPFPEEPNRPLFMGERGKRLNQGIAQKSMRDLRGILKLPTQPRLMRCAILLQHIYWKRCKSARNTRITGDTHHSARRKDTPVNADELIRIYKILIRDPTQNRKHEHCHCEHIRLISLHMPHNLLNQPEKQPSRTYRSYLRTRKE